MHINKKLFILVLLLAFFLKAGTTQADSSASTNYRVDQTFFGSGGELDASSTNYRAKQTVGELGIGLSESASYRAYAGFNTTDEPYIEFFVNASTVDIGYLDTASASTTTGTFYVRAWQAEGYVVHTQSTTPRNAENGYLLTGMSAGGSSTPGTEQFGINLIRNVNFCGAGCHLGQDPQQVPDNTFSFGEVEPGYDTSNQFKYNRGDIIARSNQSTSVTIYTVSYLFNISELTPAGQYDFRHDMVATATY